MLAARNLSGYILLYFEVAIFVLLKPHGYHFYRLKNIFWESGRSKSLLF
jgi:hypothetical protein